MFDINLQIPGRAFFFTWKEEYIFLSNIWNTNDGKALI